MADAGQKTPWYASGLNFTCYQCGRCCAGPEEGYVWIMEQEIAAVAEYLGISPEQVHRTYVRRVDNRFSLRERRDNHDCIFLTDNGQGKRGCMIYPVRPTQCRTWPFWPANLRSADAWARVGTRCPGINRGEHFDLEQIQARRDATGHDQSH